jgi:hypothetical protein
MEGETSKSLYVCSVPSYLMTMNGLNKSHSTEQKVNVIVESEGMWKEAFLPLCPTVCVLSLKNTTKTHQ